MNLWVWVKRVFKLLGLLFSALLLAFVAVNWHDEAPTPLALEMDKTAREHLSNTVPDQDNAYLYMVGFAAPEGVDPVQEGRRLVTVHNAIVARQLSGEYSLVLELPDMRQPPVLEFKGSVKKENKCSSESAATISTSAATISTSATNLDLSEAEIAHNQQLLKDNAELVRRYHYLQSLPGYRNVREPGLLLTLKFDSITKTRCIFQKAAQADIQQGNFAAALQFIERDMALARTVLAGSADLSEHSIVELNMGDALNMLTTILNNPQFDVTVYAIKLRQILQILQSQEYNLSNIFYNEFLFVKYFGAMGTAHHINSKPVNFSWTSIVYFFEELFWHPQAMENRNAEKYRALVHLAGISPSKFNKSEQIIYQQKIAAKTRRFLNPFSFDWFYDPSGKEITNFDSFDSSYFIARIFDTAAYLNLVRAQLELRLNPQASGQEAAFLKAHSDWYSPYTEAPFEWDASTRSLSFTGLAERGKKEAALREFRVFLP